MNIKLKTLILSIFYFCALLCYSQDISVTSFKLLDTDLTANTSGTSERDQNGEYAALIKIVTRETGFTFDCGMLGIVKTVQTPGEIWLYLPRGAQKITIKHPQLGVLRNYYFPVSIVGARTYEMILTTGTVTTVVKKARTTQYVIFNLQPSNAVVELDGEMLQTYDGVATKMVKFGKYEYQIKAPDYLPMKGIVEVNNPNRPTTVDISLKPNYSSVTLNTDKEAEIWINGKYQGKGIWSGTLGAGIYEFEAKREGYRTSYLTKEIVVSQDPIQFTIDSPIPIYGEANINSAPAMADIFLDGIKIGQTPFLSSEIISGSHNLKISKQGYDIFENDVVIDENKVYELNITLNKIEDNKLNKNDLSLKENIKNYEKTGKKTFDGGDYYGELKHGKPNGIGKAIYKNGNTYEGEYENGKRHGYGIYCFNDGERYEGNWYNDQQHGKGTYYFKNNNKYEGEWYRDYQHGHGIMVYYNGDKYDGEWKQDKRSGYGIYTFASGSYYKGNWLDDKKNGNGIFSWPDGSIYDGNWKNNMRSGKGFCKFANGDEYTGDWNDDDFNGKGIYKFQNGDIYEGDYVKGVRTGLGIFMYANGDKYTGQFYNGNKQGKGTFVWKSGAIYDGQWNNDKQNGRGKFTDINGTVYEGMFKDGKPQ